MNLATESLIKQARQSGSTRDAKDWLDALLSGACDQEAFFRGVGDLLHRAPDSGWDLLALVDQYYRRGKISSEVFSTLKTHLQGLLMGNGRGDDGSTSLSPRMQDEPPATLPNAARAPTATTSPVAVDAPSAAATPDIPAATSDIPAATPDIPAATPDVAAAPIDITAPPPSVAAPPSAAAAPNVAAPPTEITVPPPSVAAAQSAAAAPDVAAPPHITAPPSAAAAPRPASSRPTPPPSAATPREPADTARQRPQRSLAVGDVLRGRYCVQGLLGQGGMGTVFAAVDQYRLDRSNGDQRVALKVLHTEVIKRPRLFAELRREFQHLQSLSHPNIVRVHEFDRDGDLAFFTMEYLDGTLLRRVLAAQETSTLYRPYALAIIRDVGAAVAYAHARGVVHGDLNPGNIFITDNGEIRVVDFGASHQLHRGPWISEFENPQQIAVATLRYASCQLLEGEAADARDDVYALACITYVLLTGDHPFQEHNALKARTLRLTPNRPGGLSRRQWNALRAGLNFDRERRPADMQAWLDQLDLRAAAPTLPALPSLLTVRTRRRSGKRWTTAAAVTALIVACGWAVTTHVDSMERAGAAVSAGFKSILARTVTSQWWDKGLGGRGKAEPVIEAPAKLAPTDDAASEPPLARPQSQAKPAIATRNTEAPAAAAPRAPADEAAAQVGTGAAPAGGAAAAPRAPANEAAAPVGAGGAPAVSRAPAAAAPAVTGPSTAARAAPSAAPATPSAGPGGYPLRARIELATDNVDVAPTESVARVPVRRSRLLRGDASFHWWTESGTAKPGRDFVAVKTQVEHIENGKDAASLVIPIVVDPGRHQSRSFYVVIDQSSDAAAVGPRTLTMVTISGSD